MITEKKSFRAGLSAALCAFGVSFGAIFCPVSAFGLEADNWTLLLVCLTASVICALIFGVFRPVYGLSAAALAAGVFFWFFHTAVLESFRVMLLGILEQYVLAFHFSIPQSIADAAQSGADATTALGLLGAGLSLLTVWTVLSRCSLLGVFFASVPFLAVCLVILQTEPTTLPMLTLLGAWTLLILTQKLRFDTTQSGYRLTMHLALPVAVLLAALAFIFPRNGYVRSDWSKSLAPFVNRAAEKLTVFRENAATGQVEFVSPFTPSTLGRWAWDSSVTSVNLKRVGPQRKTGRRVMQVRSELTAISHLRADSLAIYEDSTWRALKDSDYENSGVTSGVLRSPDAAALGLTSANQLEIRTDMKSSIFYMPYRPLEFPAGGEAVFDAYVKNPSQLTEYTVPYTYVEETADRNAQYETFVHETYTQLPDDVRTELEPYVTGAQSALQTYTDTEIVQRLAQGIAQYVSGTATYSLDTPRAPDGEDFALWFLRESGTGYCVHFATATALLLRAAGIPARYVTGYYFKTQAGQWVDVTEDDAHAWVEYYLDGYGWQVLDPTPADLSETSEVQPETPETPAEPEPDQTAEPDETDTPEEPPKPETDTPETAGAAEKPGETANPAAGKTALRIVWALLVLALALCIWQVVLTALRRAAFGTGSNNKRAVMLWRHIEFLCKLDKSQPPEELHALALKARFSQHKLTGEELGRLQSFSDAQTERLLTKSAGPKRAWYALGLALHKPIRK